ncbi:MAG: Glu/Leu/Phe/Val dehydrogenase dimerization domain-containing protein, partial [bacterium]
MNKYVESVLEQTKRKNSEQVEFLQAVTEVMESISPVVERHKKYQDHAILERIVEPERVIMFRVPWQDDKGRFHVNRGFRVQFNSAIGPYKGGLRLHP